MANCPDGFWECPKCGDYVKDSLHICHYCQYDKNAEHQEAQKTPETNHSYTPSPTIQRASLVSDETSPLFSNIGGKLKKLAKKICWVGIVCSVIGGIALIIYAGQLNNSSAEQAIRVYGIAVLVCGSLISWIGSLTAYAFGDLVENTAETRKLLAKADAERNNDK